MKKGHLRFYILPLLLFSPNIIFANCDANGGSYPCLGYCVQACTKNSHGGEAEIACLQNCNAAYEADKTACPSKCP